MTLKLDRYDVAPATWEALSSRSGSIMKISPEGEIQWHIPSRESIRSDSHQVMCHCTTHYLELSGSPARVVAGHNVFGSGDVLKCFRAMVLFVMNTCSVRLPLDPALWRLTRVDVTHNYDLGSAAEVRQALSCLRHAEGGRLQVRTQSESVYWSPGSRMRSAKAYHKGPHICYQRRKNQARISDDDALLTDRLLRLELSLRSKWWVRCSKPWWRFTESDFDREHQEFFSQCVGKVEVIQMENILSLCEKLAKTPGQGRAAYRTWCSVRAVGLEETRALMPRSSWLRHRKILFAAGLTFSDFQAGNVVPLRRRVIELGAPVRSFAEMRKAA